MRIAADFDSLRGYRLPTEAEWEYACRAGTNTARYFGSNAFWLGQYAVYSRSGTSVLEPVCQYKPNDLGLFDMLGNVSEWCLDVYRPSAPGDLRDALGDRLLNEKVPRVLRGGSAVDPPSRVRAAARESAVPGTATSTVGFRVARSNCSPTGARRLLKSWGARERGEGELRPDVQEAFIY